ncbi:MAG: rhombosortase [Proteobacteria bacterium]|nr:rhombosortase [Pseudomonadota bacterium]
MASGLDRLRAAPARAWVALAALLAAGCLAATKLPTAWLDWQPALAWTQPWRWWTAAWVHWSKLHLAANLAGLMLLAALGLLARLPRRAAWAWALAWPLTQLGLALRPDLPRFGGLSGVLHAGVAVAALHLLWPTRKPRQRWIGAALLLGLALKLVLETPWGPALQMRSGWDIAIVPWSHLSGTVAGLLTSLSMMFGRRRHVSAPTQTAATPDTHAADTAPARRPPVNPRP